MANRFFRFRSRRVREEEYLSRATDLADLERRMRNLDNGRIGSF
ncbi:DUF3563 family protein [Notoacmeibacter ruber]|nr:DUF3563 family protein [Notoacmeibacter ruber]